MSTPELQLKNRLKIIHNETLCELLRKFQSNPQKEYSIDELKNDSEINSPSTLFNSLKKLKELGYIDQIARGHYKINLIYGSSLIKMLDDLKKITLPKNPRSNHVENYLALLRHYKNPELIFFKLLTTYRNIKISDLIDSGVSRATAFRILKDLTDFGLLIKNKKDKSWKLTSNMELMRKLVIPERMEIPGKIQNIFQNLKKHLPDFIQYKGAVICSIEGFPVIIDLIEENINEFSAMISAQMNLATKQCIVTDSDLEFFVNFTKLGFIIAFAFRKITLALRLENDVVDPLVDFQLAKCSKGSFNSSVVIIT